MRRGLLHGVVALLGACQEYSIDTGEEPPVEPLDTDVAAAIGVPDIEVEPSVLDFGALPQGCAAAPQLITVRNAGDRDLRLGVIELEGDEDQAAPFGLSGRLRLLAPGEEMTFTVDFTPPELGVWDRARVVIESDDPDEPVTRVDLLGEGAEDAVFEEAWVQPEGGLVDVLWVIDNSGSMSGEIHDLTSSFQTFIDAFVRLDLDFQIGVVTTDMDDPAQSGRLVGPILTNRTPDLAAAFRSQTALGASGSGVERGLDAAQAALSPPLLQGANAGLVRPGANLAVVAVSDEDDSSTVRPLAFANWLESLKPDPRMTSFSGMVGPDGGSTLFPTPACQLLGGANADHAPKYHQAIQLTGGTWGDICQLRIDDFLTLLSWVAAGLRLDFPLTYTPSHPDELEVRVDGVVVSPGAPDGWAYDPIANTVTMLGNAVPGPGAGVRISYPYATSCD